MRRLPLERMLSDFLPFHPLRRSESGESGGVPGQRPDEHAAGEVRFPVLSLLAVLTYNTLMDNLTFSYYCAAEAALANWLGIDDINEETVELVADCCHQACAALPNWRSYQSQLEKASHYVQTDMDEMELNDFVAELETQLEECGLV